MLRVLLLTIALVASTTWFYAPARAFTSDEQAYQDAGVPFSKGDYATARKLYLALLERQAKLGFAPDALQRLAVLFQLARCDHELGDERAAYEHLKPVIANLGKMQGAATETLLVMVDLQAKVTNQLELWSEEADALTRALALFTPQSGLTALDRIDIALRRSLVLMRLGRLDEGRELRRATLRDQAATPALAGEVGNNMNFVGNLLANAGFNDDAVEVFRELQGRFGATPSMPLAVSYFNLAIALRNLNRLDEGIEAGRKAAEMLEQVRGPNDRRTLFAFGGLGQNYDYAGRYVLARQWLGDAYERARKTFGVDDKDTMLYANNLADVYRRIGDLAAAERLDREALTGRLRRFGENSGDTRASRGNLAIDLQLLGRYADAADVLKPLLANLTATLGANHAETVEVRRRVASLNLSGGRLDEAEKDYAAYANDAALERLDPTHRVYLLNARAAIAEKRGQRAEELKLRERTLALAREALGPDHPDTLQFFADVLHSRPATVAELAELDDRVLDWARREVAISADPQTRQRLLSLFSTTRNLVVDEAFRAPDADHRAVLVTAMERWKGVGLREDQLLARLAGEGGDAKAAALARELAERNAAAERRGAAATRVAELRTQLSETSPA